MPVVVRDEFWPLVVITVSDPLGPDEFSNAIYAMLDTVVARREPCCFVLDTREREKVPDPVARKKLAAFRQKATELGVQRYVTGVAFVTPSPLLRAVLSAVDWFVPFPVPRSWEQDMQSAVRFCLESLRTRRVDVPPALNDYAARLAAQ